MSRLVGRIRSNLELSLGRSEPDAINCLPVQRFCDGPLDLAILFGGLPQSDSNGLPVRSSDTRRKQFPCLPSYAEFVAFSGDQFEGQYLLHGSERVDPLEGRK